MMGATWWAIPACAAAVLVLGLLATTAFSRRTEVLATA